ncbi:MAG: VWA domain-containing protein [Syntrophomonadaceae bacterium]|nr:VWA domain-containing protein [Syntrophomonadaceae bacterium]
MQEFDAGRVANAEAVGNYLNLYFSQNEGVRLGESSVVSRRAHARMPEKRIKGQIRILTNQDAGKHYLDYIDEDQVVHIDIYHQPGDIDPVYIARAIYRAFEKYILQQDPQLKYAEAEYDRILHDHLRQVILSCNGGFGELYELVQGRIRPLEGNDEGRGHIHILARFQRENYRLVYVIAIAVEEALSDIDIKPAKVSNITHGKQKETQEDFSDYLRLPWKTFKGHTHMTLPDKENVNMLVVKLAERLGGVKEIEEFMDSYSTNVFRRKGMEEQSKKWGDIEDLVDQMEELDIIKNTPLGKVLTKNGARLKEYMVLHEVELETEIRRNIRRMPGSGNSRYKKLGSSDRKRSPIEFVNYQKTIRNTGGSWGGNLAVPSTIVQAKINSVMRGDSRLTIDKTDLHYYDKKTYIPIDICLLLDASGSMAGDKRQAACYLAQHLLLTGRERVAVVTFQDRMARVAVPFTKNLAALNTGLASINPSGLTPLTHGIVTAMKHIERTRAKNPLMVLITDGLPNVPKWTVDARADALQAAEEIKEKKVRFICIGMEANKYYLEKLCDAADGALYLVDDLNKGNLINIVRHETRQIKYDLDN